MAIITNFTQSRLSWQHGEEQNHGDDAAAAGDCDVHANKSLTTMTYIAYIRSSRSMQTNSEASSPSGFVSIRIFTTRYTPFTFVTNPMDHGSQHTVVVVVVVVVVVDVVVVIAVGVGVGANLLPKRTFFLLSLRLSRVPLLSPLVCYCCRLLCTIIEGLLVLQL